MMRILVRPVMFDRWNSWARRAGVAATLVGASLFTGTALAADAAGQLRGFVKDVKSATGTFTQVTRSSQGQAATPQTGRFAFERPGKFRWDVQKPYEQLTVSDGKQLYQYDPDLAQVSVRGAAAAVGNAPAQVLFGEGSLEAAFTLQSLGEREGLDWLRAIPRGTDAGFAHMDIGFSGNLPEQIVILDAFGQTTQVEFNTIVPNPTVPASEFTFVAPQGVDVVKMP